MPANPRRRERHSVARVVLKIIHDHSLWQFYGSKGYDLAVAAVKNEFGTPLSAEYFYWIKSRYIAQSVLGLPIDRVMKFTVGQRLKIKAARVMPVSKRGNVFAALLRSK